MSLLYPAAKVLNIYSERNNFYFYKSCTNAPKYFKSTSQPETKSHKIRNAKCVKNVISDSQMSSFFHILKWKHYKKVGHFSFKMTCYFQGLCSLLVRHGWIIFFFLIFKLFLIQEVKGLLFGHKAMSREEIQTLVEDIFLL